MASHLELARALYRALGARDMPALLGILHPDFEGHVTAGLPNDFGGSYRGPQAMLGFWRRVSEAVAIAPEPTEFLEAEDGRVVVLGHYRGETVGAGVPVDAAFVHVLRMRDGRIVELCQITDSQRWTDALGSSANVAVVRRVMKAVPERDLAVVLEAYAVDVEIHDAESLPYGGVYRGHDGTVEHATRYPGTWGPLQKAADTDTEEIVFGDGNRVVAVWRQKATGRDGTAFNMPAVSLFELRGEKVIRLRMFHYDTAAIGRFLS